MDLQILTTDEVLQIHNALESDFADTHDPISPSGLQSRHLLESAVSRQLTGYRGKLKYPDPESNAATLLYGICCNHPFYNGNKRTALVAMLVHLDKNKLALFDTREKDLYRLMIQVADHTFGMKTDKRSQDEDLRRLSHDEEVGEIAYWIRKRADNLIRGERPITYRELKRILGSFGYSLDNHHGNSIDINRYETKKVRKGLFGHQVIAVPKHIGTISWPGEHREVPIGEIKRVRAMCGLRVENGIDSEAFYNYSAVVDSFVNRYRRILHRLGKV